MSPTARIAQHLLVVAVVVLIATALRTPHLNVPAHLGAYQDEEMGGVIGSGGKVTIQATKEALLLAAVHGDASGLLAKDAVAFIQSRAADPHGFHPYDQAPPTAQSLFDAVLSLQLAGAATPPPDSVIAAVEALRGGNGLFAMSAAHSPSLEATYMAVMALDLVGALEDCDLTAVRAMIPKALPPKGTLSPEDAQGVDSVTGAFYVVRMAEALGIPVDVEEVATWLPNQQSSQGGFPLEGPTLWGTYHAAALMHTLERLHAPSLVDVEALEEYVMHLGGSEGLPDSPMTTSSLVHLAMAMAGRMTSVAQSRLAVQGADENGNVVIGTAIRPMLMFTGPSGRPHKALSAYVAIHLSTESSSPPSPVMLPMMMAANGVYAIAEGDAVSTQNQLGRADVVVKASVEVPWLGVIDLIFEERLSVGLKVSLEDASTSPTGSPLSPGGVMGPGSTVKVSTTVGDAEGDLGEEYMGLKAIFTITDGSGVVVHSEESPVDLHALPLDFTWTWPEADAALSPGALVAAVDVTLPDQGGMAGRGMVRYVVDGRMVAVDAVASSDRVQLGEKVTVRFRPMGTTASYGQPIPLPGSFLLSPLPLLGNTPRPITVEVVGPHGEVVHTRTALPEREGSPTYKAEWTIPPHADQVGTFALRMVLDLGPAGRVVLPALDATTLTVLDDPATPSLPLEVEATLKAISVEGLPVGEDLTYGSPVGVTFKVVDETSGLTVEGPLRVDQATMYLSVGKDEEDPFRVRVPASFKEEDGVYHVHWRLSANVAPGKAVMILTHVSAALHPTPLSPPSSLYIKGEIVAEGWATSQGRHSEEWAVLHAGWTLQADGEVLHGARLLCEVGGLKEFYPVAIDANGQYTTSAVISHEDSPPSGSYTLECYRYAHHEDGSPKVDRSSPVVSLPLTHVNYAAGLIPFRMEVVASVLLAVLIFAASHVRRGFKIV